MGRSTIKSKLFNGAQFVAIPMAALHSRKFLRLSPWALKLLLDLLAQFNGSNNGDLSAAMKIMKKRGWRSPTTLSKAKKELLDAGFIYETRKGRLPNTCSLYGVTWHALNPSPKLDITPAGFPRGAWHDP